MMHTLQLLPAIGCAAMMLGGGVLTRRLAKAPLAATSLKHLGRLLPGKIRHAGGGGQR
jgi:hypothetical protein